MTMTLDLKEHMAKKDEEARIKAFNDVGAALNGLPIGTALQILGAVSASAVRNMPPAERIKIASMFYGVLARPPESEETMQ